MGDVDTDGDLDLVLAGDDAGHLYLNKGDGTFGYRRSFANTNGYMGGLADLDNDGDLDLVFAGDDVDYLNDGSGQFTMGPRISLPGINDPRGIVFADIDDDGDLDFERSGNQLIRNDFAVGNWLKLISPTGQAGAYGAKALVYARGDGRGLLGMRESRSNNGYLGQDDPVLHFGLGRHAFVDVVVKFLNGRTVKRNRVAANQVVTFDGRR